MRCLWLFLLLRLSAAEIRLAIVVCGDDRLEQGLVSLRSALLSTNSPLDLHIVHGADDGNRERFASVLSRWQANRSFTYHFYETRQPAAYTELFARCACQRLFLHQLLPLTVERIVYVDSDTIFLAPIDDLWSILQGFDPTTLAGMAAESPPTTKAIPWYQPARQHPYYHEKGVLGVNSGVILLNLEYLREKPWENEMERHRRRYPLEFADQDLLNIYFFFHPERLQLINCQWNYRADFCYFEDIGESMRLLHGSRGVFYPKERQGIRAFQLIYEAFLLPEEELGSCSMVYERFQAAIRQIDKEVLPENQCEISVLRMAAERLQILCGDSSKDEL